MLGPFPKGTRIYPGLQIAHLEDLAMKDVHTAISRGRGKEGVGGVEGNSSHLVLVVLHCAVRLGAQVQVVPGYPVILQQVAMSSMR